MYVRWASITIPIEAYNDAYEWFEKNYEDRFADVIRYPDELYLGKGYVSMIFPMDKWRIWREEIFDFCFAEIKPTWESICVDYREDELDYEDPYFYKIPKRDQLVRLDTAEYNILIQTEVV